MPKFNSFKIFFTLLISTLVIVSLWAISVNAQAPLTENSKLAINGIGPIRVGMTVNEASQSAGVKLVFVASGPDAYSCSYFKPQVDPQSISFMVAKGRIARVDISNERIATIRGAKIGDTEDRIISLYPGQIQITKHPFPLRPNENRKHLTFVPKDASDKNYRIIFETGNNRVYHLRSGKLPEVGYIEGCL